MTLVLSSDQLADMQMDLDIGDNQLVFTDDELNRFYTRASGVFYKAEVLAVRVLLASNSKFVSYTEGQTQEDRSDRFKQVQAFLTYLETVVLQGTTGQYRMIHIRSVPTVCRDRPYDRYNSYGGYGLYGNGYGRKCGGW